MIKLPLLVIFLLLATGNQAEDDIKKSINKFGEKLIKVVKEGRRWGNVFVSSQALVEGAAILYNGASGDTASSIASAFGFSSVDQVNSQMQKTIPLLRDEKGGSNFVTVSRKIHVSTKYKVTDKFKSTIEQIFAAGVYNTDLQESLESQSVINRCVAEETRDVIEDVILYESLKYDTTLVMVVGLFVQGPWTVPFDPAQTKMEDFFVNDYHFPVEIMHLQAQFDYYEDKAMDAKFLELPFSGGVATLVIVLPNKVTGLDKLIGNINKSSRPNYKKETVRVSLPKFQIKARWDGADLIKKATGLTDFGDTDDSDLSGIGGKKGDLKLGVFQQLDYIRINEAGILVPPIPANKKVPTPPGANQNGPNVKEFNANHPFLFIIVREGFVTFQGFVQDPSVALTNYLRNDN